MRLLDKLHSGGVYTIAELSVNHAGSLDLALDAVRLAARRARTASRPSILPATASR